MTDKTLLKFGELLNYSEMILMLILLVKYMILWTLTVMTNNIIIKGRMNV